MTCTHTVPYMTWYMKISNLYLKSLPPGNPPRQVELDAIVHKEAAIEGDRTKHIWWRIRKTAVTGVAMNSTLSPKHELFIGIMGTWPRLDRSILKRYSSLNGSVLWKVCRLDMLL
ncbi:hypothetical protein P8452_33435 [Trifolium repens]|nr:hypothetical protein P8452_33435 [Trifolium repens]